MSFPNLSSALMVNIRTRESEHVPLMAAVNVRGVPAAAPNAAAPSPAPAPTGEAALTPSQRALIKKHGWSAERLYPELFEANAPVPAPAPVPGRGMDSLTESQRAIIRRFGWNPAELYPERFEGTEK